jgi:hypothetical protein
MGEKERGARQRHKRLLYCVKVTNTSLDHLLLGKCADIDRLSTDPIITLYCNLPYSALAPFNTGTSASAPFHSAKKS